MTKETRKAINEATTLMAVSGMLLGMSLGVNYGMPVKATLWIAGVAVGTIGIVMNDNEFKKVIEKED